MATGLAFFTNDNFLFRDCNPATYCQASLCHDPFNPRVYTTIEAALSPMASPGILHCKSQLLSMTPPVCQVSILCGRFLYITKFGCKLEMPSQHPLDHILGVPTLWKSSLEDFPSMMLIPYQPQNCRLSSLWDPNHSSSPPRTKCYADPLVLSPLE